MSETVQDVTLTKEEEEILDKAWERVAIRQGMGHLWAEYRKQQKSK